MPENNPLSFTFLQADQGKRLKLTQINFQSDADLKPKFIVVIFMYSG